MFCCNVLDEVMLSPSFLNPLSRLRFAEWSQPLVFLGLVLRLLPIDDEVRSERNA